ncbi:hypothetical protein JTE90_009511 [Oedothorax gibbosus]|uniref:7TM GPCR serpentine receptor class x (Srx) domain-containing protein n=1 Tax=Oedothorax gibbosus TaxID=931172 RepID=A0AAV6UTB4_9ARAC|nr:hypothetical protein JTE90_009511 [Oedothorax gibbosus]
MHSSTTCSSSANVAFISVDRSITVAYPLQHQSIVTDKAMFGFMGWMFLEGSTIGTILRLLKCERYFISVCNFLIINTAKRSGKTNNQPMFVRRQSDSHMKKTMKSMFVVVATYYICFTPTAN